MTNRHILAGAVLCVLLAVPPGALGSGTAVPTLTVSYLPDVGYAPYFVAKSKGLFKRYGVDVKLANVPYNVIASEVVSGRIDIATTSPGRTLNVADEGMPVSTVYALTQNPGFALISTPTIRTLAALRSTRGCRIATSTMGALGYGWYLEYKAKLGLDNCTPLYEQSLSATVAAVASGAAQAAVVAKGTAVTADLPPPRGAGTHLLVDPTAKGWQKTYSGLQPYPVPTVAATLWGLRSNLEAKRKAVVSLLAALDEAMRLMTPANFHKVATWIRLGDPADFGTQSVDHIVQELRGEAPWIGLSSVILPHVPKGHRQPDPKTLVGYISPFTWKSSLATLAAIRLPNFDPAAAANQYRAIVDMSYWRQAYQQYLRKRR